MATFTNTTNPTPFKFFDDQTEFQSEADNIFQFISFAMGASVISVELSKKTIWANLEHATLEFAYYINSYQAKSQLSSMLGLPSGSNLSGSQNRHIAQNLNFLDRSAEPYGAEIGLGGRYNTISGSIDLEQGRQDYDILTELLDTDKNPVFQSQQATGSRGKMKVFEVFHYDPDVSFLALTASPSINYLSAEFNFESFSRGTHFFTLPVFEDVLRMSQYKQAFRVRRSNYSWRITGTKIRIFPKPTVQNAKKLFLRVGFPPDPNNPSFPDDSVYGISNISNLPFGEIEYSKINSVGKQWIRKFTLALSKESLGLIRSKFKSIPIPGNTLDLDGAELIEQARQDKEQLREELKELLESLTYKNLTIQEADRAEALNKQLKYTPMPNPVLIF